jgi:hypothetical protein
MQFTHKWLPGQIKIAREITKGHLRVIGVTKKNISRRAFAVAAGFYTASVFKTDAV